jgi:hypothetical protein
MKRRLWFVPVIVCAVVVAGSCGKESPTPSSPSPAVPADTQANADGSNLKATAPSPQSPVNGARIESGVITLRVGNSNMRFASGVPLSYRFEVYNAGGARVYQSGLVGAGQGSTSHDVQGALDGDQTYSWQARAEYLGAVGPWSARTSATFIAPNNVGFMRGNELYDPLIGGKSIGNVVGPHTWLPGVGLRLDAHESYVSYELPETLTEGEFSVLTTNLAWNTKGGKTKIMAMGQGYSDIVTNDRRMTIEKRGDPPGIVAWRLITHGDQVDTEGHEREEVMFDTNEVYLWQATFRNNFFNVQIFKGAGNGDDIYDKGKHFEGRAYDPNPHVVYLGAPVGRSGTDGASIPGVIYRHLWVSSRPRPAFANK